MYFSFKLSKVAKPLCLTLVLLMAVTAVISFASHSVPTMSDESNKLPSLKAKDEEQRQQVLTSLGWVTNEVSPVEEEVIIPKEFDEIYTKYNNLQKKQNLDLKKYRGKTVTKYTYFIKNYPDMRENVRLTLLVKKGKIIGGDVCSLGLNGFMHTLFYPQTEKQSA